MYIIKLLNSYYVDLALCYREILYNYIIMNDIKVFDKKIIYIKSGLQYRTFKLLKKGRMKICQTFIN